MFGKVYVDVKVCVACGRSDYVAKVNEVSK